MSTTPTAGPEQPIELDLRRALRHAGRALCLRCPHCAGRGLFLSPLRLRPDCPSCGLALDRGEPDYFLGAYVLNLMAVEALFAAVLVIVLVATWPSPPWTLLQYGAAALMVLGAVVCYPFAKVLWIAVDLTLRPVTPAELPGPLPPELLPDGARGSRGAPP
ncbi:MAG TPA: DUF983 domain-containing protein [Gemmatimonadaceae bacterium]|nr:DUF983 domain-containing protein [Gemmatimonadaceae bacterium]